MPQSAFFSAGRVVHAVAGHADDVAALLQHLDDVVLVLGEDLREAVGLLDRSDRAAPPRGAWCRSKHAGVENVGAQAELAGDLLGDGELVAGDHLDVDAQLLRPWRSSPSSPRAADRRAAARRGTARRRRRRRVATPSERKPRFGECVDRPCRRRRGPASALADSARMTCGAPLVDLELAAVGRLDRRLGALVHGIEGLEVRRPDSARAPPGP